MIEGFRPRLSVDITEEQNQKLVQYLDHGMRKAIFGIIIDDLLELIKNHGAGPVLGLLIERSISLKDVCRLNKLGG